MCVALLGVQLYTTPSRLAINVLACKLVCASYTFLLACYNCHGRCIVYFVLTLDYSKAKLHVAPIKIQICADHKVNVLSTKFLSLVDRQLRIVHHSDVDIVV